MKQLATLLLIIIAANPLPAQLTDSSQINKSLEIVLQHFPAGFAEIRGELVGRTGQTSTFKSQVSIPGSLETVITEQTSFGRKRYSWRCDVYRHVNKEEVVSKYFQLFNQLNNSIIRSRTDKPYILSGKYTEPSGQRTNISRFKLLPSTGELRNATVDLMIVDGNTGTVLSILVHQ